MAKTAANPFLEALAQVFGTALASQLLDPLQKIHDKNPKKFGVKVKAVLLLFGEIAELTTKSPTKIDDAAVNAVIDVLKQSAQNNNVKI